MKISAIVLSGGNATRMGGEKPFRKINNKYMIENVINVLVENNMSFVIVFKHLDNISSKDIIKQKYLIKKYGQTITWDIIFNKGPVVGILSGMRLLNTEWIITLPCDMPFISKNSLSNLLSYISSAESLGCNCIIPKHENGHIEPLFSIYNKSTIGILENLVKQMVLQNKSYPIRMFIKKLKPLYVPVKYIDSTSKTFININSHHELKAFKNIKKEKENMEWKVKK
jgi:molybdopterin-guanine dinucleotide biosynthesis protein A